MKYTTCFFDLDGTITDPSIGITNSVMHALSKYGIRETDRTKLYPFIGPPLQDSFLEYYGIDDGDRPTAYFREYFGTKGIFENEPYPGVREFLLDLKDAGVRVAMATSKPELYANMILEHFGLADCFDHVTGATFDESLVHKPDILRAALRDTGADPERSVMIGDRRFDILGGHAVGIDAIGVLWGFGGRNELEEAGADAVAADFQELRKLVGI